MSTAIGALQKQTNREIQNRSFSLTDRMAGDTGLMALLTGHPLGAVGGAAAAFASKMGRERGASTIASLLDRASKTELLGSVSDAVTKRIGGAAGAFATAERMEIPAAASILHSVQFTPGGGSLADESPGKVPDAKQAYQQRVAELQALASNPARLTRLAADRTAAIRTIAPEHANALQAQHTAAMQFLISKLPQATAPSSILKQPPLEPADSDVEKMATYVHALDKPMDAMHLAVQGNGSPEAAEAIRTVYPQMFQEMKAATVKAMQSAEEPPSYQQLVSASSFFGVPLDPSMNPQYIQSLQQLHQAAGQKQSPAQAAPRPHSKVNFKSIDDVKSGSQRIEGT